MLVRAVLEDRRQDVPELLLELGVFRTGPVAIAQEIIDPYFDLLLEMVREDPPYMFGEDERFYEKIMELGAANWTQSMDAHFPEDIIFIDRSFAGHFGNLTTLRAQGPWREIVDQYTRSFRTVRSQEKASVTASTSESSGRPTLTAVLATIDNYQRIEKTLEHYRAQTARPELEVLIVASSKEVLQLDPAAVEGFFDSRVIEVGEIQSLSAAKALAVAQAKADWVVFGEDHSWPEPTWAEALIAAHREGYALVGPIIKNANPGSILSWTNYLACFSRWSHSGMAGQVTQTPWHNTSYLRADLMERQDNLRRLLAVEGILQDELREKGHRAYLLPDVSTNHINISRFSSWILQAFWGGKLYGGSRVEGEDWGFLRRLIYIGGGPLFP